ncbi:hypothetical protein JOF56_003755 [Kibdelosporangium banguiense]|uniref:Uncharacterized protein n=1 Tax=Kibdelosporangium banguiense TaxID=1365924 RepID=A0ABS4TG25_9PSEU|nr:hypothetical protein [Kibdelosporangium banguiense]MBP2323370.1 hypothetical protein [Kibdelosporangium banguiense]
MALVWVALAPIWHGQFRAFNIGEIVPDSVEARWDYSGQGLVARQEIPDGGSPDLEEIGVAFRKDVVLRSQLHLGKTPPESPAVGTVWIDTSV